MAPAVAQEEDEDVWEATDTSPGAIEAALRALLAERHQRRGAVIPARTLNLVLVCDRRFRGEIAQRLGRAGNFLPSRIVVCAVTRGRRELDARAVIAARSAGGLTFVRERIDLDIGEHHLKHLETVVDPIVVADVPTLAWCPHGHYDAEVALRELAQVLLVDAIDGEVAETLERIEWLSQGSYVVDLAWLRSSPWRERTAAAFDPPGRRKSLGSVASVEVLHRTDSVAPAALYVGWLAARLGWQTGPLVAHGDKLTGTARTRRGEVRVTLAPVRQETAPGLAAVAIGDASGARIGLERAPGGLIERRVAASGATQAFQVLGASRGEGGILAEGVRQALLRDNTYAPALAAARALVSR